MYLLPFLCVFGLLPLALMLKEDSVLSCVPRKSVPFNRENLHLFREEGVFNYTTMLLREDLNLLVLGARESVYALKLQDISNQISSVKWEVTQQQKTDCNHKGKDPEVECKNYIRILHKMTDDRMYVCGTNAFDPVCDYLSFADGKLRLEKKGEDGKGKCPFDPFQKYASIMVDNALYSATSMNFLGSEPVLMRSSSGTIRTEFKSSWLNEPTFVSMAQMPESERSLEGDDDKVYLFFSETAVECDCFNTLVVSRVARVCKGDLGGMRTLQKRWTSFLKARIDCPVLESQLPYIITDSYRWCDPQQDWKNCLFFGIFTPQSDTLDLSAVCAYSVADISKVFAEGKYKSPVAVETSFVKWVMYSGDVPSPRPGACINNEARKAGVNKTLDLPDRTLQFIKDKPLMDQTIRPIGLKPLLVRKGAKFTRIVVDQVVDAEDKRHHVMFIGTVGGTVLKAVNFNGEMFIIEEIEVFQPPNEIKILKISAVTGQLYAGSDNGAAQIPLATCERSVSCMDCVLARDPYCGWDQVVRKCIPLKKAQSKPIQSVEEGNASLCPKAGPVKPMNQTIWPGGNLKLSCPSPSNLAETSWEMNGQKLPSANLQLLPDGLLILNASHSDAGSYRCLSVERSKAVNYTTVVAEYEVRIALVSTGKGLTTIAEAQKDGPSVLGLRTVVGLLVVALLVLLAWNFCKGHIPLPWKCGQEKTEQSQGPCKDEHVGFTATRSKLAEDKPLVPTPGRSNNNHRGQTANRDDNVSDADLPVMQFTDESKA